MSIKDWGTVEKIQQKFKKVLLLSNICSNCEKKYQRNVGKKFREVLRICEKIFKNANFILAFQKIVEVLDNLMKYRQALKMIITKFKLICSIYKNIS